MSGLLITAVAPGGQGDGAAGALSAATASAGGGGATATAGIGAGGGAASATASTGITGGGAGVATARTGLGRCTSIGAGVPVKAGASAIGPGGGSAVVNSLISAMVGGAGCSIGEHAPSHSGVATMIAADHTTPIRRPPQPRFPRLTIVESSISGMASPGVISPEDYSLPVLYGTTRERTVPQSTVINPRIARHKSAAR